MSEEATVQKKLQCRGAEKGTEAAPLDSYGERDFLQERVGLYALSTLLASASFFFAGFAIEVLWPPHIAMPRTFARPDVLFHLATCAVLLLMWLLARQRGISSPALHAIDAAGTIATFACFAFMASSMPAATRPPAGTGGGA